MGNRKAFILAYIFAVVCFAESSADGVNTDALVLERLSTLERELRESRIDHAKSTELLRMEILDARLEHETTTEKLLKELSDTRAELNAFKIMFSEIASTHHGFNESSDHNMPNAVLARASRQTSTYAFTAYLDDTTHHLNIDQTIIFNRILSNKGNAYNRFTGIFTCPVDGMYVFSFFVANASIRQMFAELVIDGTTILHAVADSRAQAYDLGIQVQGGNLAVVYCGQGSAVRVTNVHWSDAQVRGLDTYRLSSFSGFLLS